MERETEDEVMHEEKEMRERRLLSPLKVPDSIEARLLQSKPQNDGKEWGKNKGEDRLKFCETGENPPL